MKLVREHINEKFTEEGDSIQDMGIGIDGLIEKYKKKIAKSRNWGRIGDNVDDATAAGSMAQEMNTTGWREREQTLTDDEFDLHMKMLERLFKRGVDINAVPSLLSNVLGIKHPKPRRTKALKLILKYGLKLKSLDGYFYKSDNTDDIKTLKLLVEAGLLQRKEKFKQTWLNNVLKWASDGNNDEMIIWIVEKGADASSRNHYALQKALEKDQKELIKVLAKQLLKEPDYK